MHTIGDFPIFTPLELKHKEVLREIAGQFPPYSDFNFVSMFTWNNDGLVAVSLLNDNLVVRFSGYADGEIFYSILGETKLEKSIDTIFAYLKKSEEPQILKLVGEVVINSLSLAALKKYRITEDHDNHDYILSTSRQSDLANFHKKKKKAHRLLMDEHGQHIEAKEIDLSDSTKQEEIFSLLHDWDAIKPRDHQEAAREYGAIRNCLKHAKELNILAFGTYIRGKLVAFTLFEIVHDKTAIAHFGKANTNITGVSAHFEHNLANFLAGLDVALMNDEQDLGIEGLRISKKSYKPVGYLKKFTIEPIEKLQKQ